MRVGYDTYKLHLVVGVSAAHSTSYISLTRTISVHVKDFALLGRYRCLEGVSAGCWLSEEQFGKLKLHYGVCSYDYGVFHIFIMPSSSSHCRERRDSCDAPFVPISCS